MSTIPDRHPHPSRLLRHVDDTSVLTKRSFPSVFAGCTDASGATLARYVSQLVPSKIPTRQWSLRGRAAWATCDPGGARSTPGDRYQRRVEHVVGVKRAVHALERGHAPRLSPTVRAPSGTTSLSNVRPSVVPSNIRCIIPTPIGQALQPGRMSSLSRRLSSPPPRYDPYRCGPAPRGVSRRATIHPHNRATPG